MTLWLTLWLTASLSLPFLTASRPLFLLPLPLLPPPKEWVVRCPAGGGLIGELRVAGGAGADLVRPLVAN